MKEILFRGFHPDEDGTQTIILDGKKIKGKWVYGYYIEATQHWHKYGIHNSWIITSALQNGGYFNVMGRYPVIPETVGQYTGLTDKNGNKIFEGDIVVFRYERNKDICTVVFENGAFGLGQHKQFNYNELQVSVDKETGNPDFFVGNDNYISLWEIAWNYNEFAGEDLHLLEVIGNIYDNPELLNKD